MSTTPTFHAGICMAGAVSAGAYTAGVMDYLIEALEHWEKAKQLQAKGKLSGVPKHNFIIDVLGGASAGGMTAAITAAGIQQKFDPVTINTIKNEQLAKQNPLYNAWVNLKETKEHDMMDLLLNTDDIEKDTFNKQKEVRAGFNSNFIKDIASDMLDKRVAEKYERPYIAPDLEIFTTLTNLRGFAYKVIFRTSTGTREHRMRMHRDYAFFKLDENPNSETVGKDGRIPVNFTAPDGLNTQVLKQAAMSTGAFPVGLESRDLLRGRHFIENNKYLNLMKADEKVEYNFLPEGDFLSLNVDGGVINNEPYEITESLLEDRQGIDELKRTGATFNSVVLMIDPFPNDDEAETEFVPKKAWKHVLPSILGAMRSQLMMKDEQIKRAYLSDDYTRFLIMPQRSGGDPAFSKFTIACGALGGFGGFFSKEFRRHDYLLGRRNCQRFLQHNFTVAEHAGNPILSFGYEGVTTYGKILITEKKADNTAGQSKPHLCIIPDIRVTGDEVSGYKITIPAEEQKYPYPKIQLTYITGLRDKISKRVKCVLDNVQNAEGVTLKINPALSAEEAKIKAAENNIIERLRKKSWFKRQLAAIKSPFAKVITGLVKTEIKDTGADFFIESIVRDMHKRGLLEDDLK
jgi:Patatin-like phospholipase